MPYPAAINGTPSGRPRGLHRFPAPNSLSDMPGRAGVTAASGSEVTV
jgi:hypothetical protein